MSFEFLSRGAASVTSVEKAATQARFIEKVARELHDDNLRLLRTDAVRRDEVPGIHTITYESEAEPFDIVFADPPYDMPGFGEIPGAVLSSGLLGPGSLFVMEHSKAYDFSSLPHFMQHRAYGSVNFSIFHIDDEEAQ